MFLLLNTALYIIQEAWPVVWGCGSLSSLSLRLAVRSLRMRSAHSQSSHLLLCRRGKVCRRVARRQPITFQRYNKSRLSVRHGAAAHGSERAVYLHIPNSYPSTRLSFLFLTVSFDTLSLAPPPPFLTHGALAFKISGMRVSRFPPPPLLENQQQRFGIWRRFMDSKGFSGF